MPSIKFINDILYDREYVQYTLEIYFDENKIKHGVLTVPTLNYDSPFHYNIDNNVYNISGKQLDCIERQFFDNTITVIPIEEYEEPINFTDLVLHTLPHDVYKKMLDGTFTLKKDANRNIYGNFRSI